MEWGKSENPISSLKKKLGSWSGKYQPSPNQNLYSQFLEPPFPSLQRFLPKLFCLSYLLSLVLTSGYFLGGACIYATVFLLLSGALVKTCTDTGQLWECTLKMAVVDGLCIGTWWTEWICVNSDLECWDIKVYGEGSDSWRTLLSKSFGIGRGNAIWTPPKIPLSLLSVLLYHYFNLL